MMKNLLFMHLLFKQLMFKHLLFKSSGLFLLLTVPLMAGCNALLSKQPLQTAYYSLESVQSEAQASPILNTKDKLPILIINTPNAAAGFDTRRMMYTRNLHQLEYFARNEWVDTPANMLQPLLVSAIEKTGDFSAVLPKRNLVKSELRLESEIVRLIHTFNNKLSQVQFTLRATMIDNATGQVIAYREFDERVNATTDNPIGGVIAANQAVNTVLEKLSTFSSQAASTWRERVTDEKT